VNSTKQLLCQTSQNTSISDSVSVNLTPDNEFNTMHSIAKVLSSMGIVSNEIWAYSAGSWLVLNGSFTWFDYNYSIITNIQTI